MRSSTRPRHHLAAAAVAGVLVLAACGGGDDSISSAQPGAESGDDAADDQETESDAAPVAPATGAGFVDLVGADVVAESDIESNLLPDVVIDDVTNGRKVNFRNLVPQDKPILLWMYAPH